MPARSTKCSICLAENRQEMEDAAQLALQGRESWRKVALDLGLTHAQGLRNHMEKHYAVEQAAVAGDRLTKFREQVAEQHERVVEERLKELEYLPLEMQLHELNVLHNFIELLGSKGSPQGLAAAMKAQSEAKKSQHQRSFLEAVARAMPVAAPPPQVAIERDNPPDIEEAELVEGGE